METETYNAVVTALVFSLVGLLAVGLASFSESPRRRRGRRE